MSGGEAERVPAALSAPELRRLVEFAVHLTRLAGERILPYFRAQPDVIDKGVAGAFDPVTAADRAAEEVIREEIRREFPEHGILGEEQGAAQGASAFTWIIDPIDGTRAFILGQLHWGTLIALNEGSRPVLGVMRQPYVDETFVGSALGAELRRGGTVSPLKARGARRLQDAIVCITDPALFETAEERAAIERLASRVRMVRYGGDCYTPCLLAAGHVDLVVESGLKPWDVQPLIPIVEAAGGIVTDWNANAPDGGGTALYAANRELHSQALAALAGAHG